MNRLTRENLHPLWAGLTERVERARETFRQGGSEEAFKAALGRLGYDGTAILIEVECNRPEPAEIIEARVKKLIAGVSGIPRSPLVLEFSGTLVVWQPDGEVKTLRRKP